MRPSSYALHGLVVASPDVELDARAAPADATADVEFRLLPPAVVAARGERLDGRVMAALDLGPGAALTVVECGPATPPMSHGGPAAHQAVFHGFAAATIDRTGSRVDLVLAPDADPAFASVLLAGTVMSVLLVVRGHPVLHASGVTVPVDGREVALAFVGRSGMGKSTLATLLCRDGAALLGDDVLRTDVQDDTTVLAWPGATSTRLRPAAQPLGQQSADALQTTADGRLSATLAPAGPEPVPLLALVVPGPDREATAVRVQRIRGAAAVLTLASFPRVLGWSDPATSAAAHRHWGELARRVPIMTAHVPWGPPFAPGLGAEVLAAVLEEISGTADGAR